MLLGIDFGLKNIGLAVSEGEIAQPLKTLKIKNQEDGLNQISNLTKQMALEKVVVGISEGASKARALGFGRQLETMLQLPVDFIDETLSTFEAYSPNRRDKAKEHAKAAAIILQRYLDSNHKYTNKM